ncbi:putative FERM domain-containing protein FRMD8P1 [Glandiceps talaboti]
MSVESGLHSYRLQDKPQAKPRLKMPPHLEPLGPTGSGLMTPITQTLYQGSREYPIPSTASSVSKCLDVCIFLRNGTGHEFNVEGCKRATAQELSDLMQANLGLPEIATELFCLWLTSPLLKLQLKPHHVPYKLYRQWPDLLDRFTSATEDQKNRDEPILCYQRNAFFPKCKEKRIRSEKALEMLYEEAKHNILEGYYPCSSEEYDRYAGLLARIELGPYEPKLHTSTYFKDKLPNFYPAPMCKTSWSLPLSSKTTAEYRIVDEYKNLSANNEQQCKKTFLKSCWSLPFYGCVFFTGQIERPHAGKKVKENHDRPASVGINRDGVFLVCVSKSELLLALSYDDLSWEYTEPAKAHSAGLPCLWLQFDIEENGNTVSKILQVFSKQAIMMNAMIEACVEEINQVDPNRFGAGTGSREQLDGGQDTVDAPVDMPVQVEKKSQLNRLSLATVSTTGEVVQKPNKKPSSWATIFRRQDSTKGT